LKRRRTVIWEVWFERRSMAGPSIRSLSANHLPSSSRLPRRKFR
jgi:hypothetical protein